MYGIGLFVMDFAVMIWGEFVGARCTVPYGSQVAFHISYKKQLSLFPPVRVSVETGHKKMVCLRSSSYWGGGKKNGG